MNINFVFIMNSVLLGVGLAMDALSVGFTIADYNFLMALICALIIAVVTFVICIAGLIIGKKVGTKLAGKANIPDRDHYFAGRLNPWVN